MLVSFRHTVQALTESILQERVGSDAKEFAGLVSRLIVEQHSRMPDYLRRALSVLTLIFGAWPLLSSGQPFHRLSAARKELQISAWKHSTLGVKRDFIRFYESLTLFAWSSEIHEPPKSVTS